MDDPEYKRQKSYNPSNTGQSSTPYRIKSKSTDIKSDYIKRIDYVDRNLEKLETLSGVTLSKKRWNYRFKKLM